MKRIINTLIPFKGFLAMTIWPFIFIRKEYANKFGAKTENHESIHGDQQKELLLIPFIIWYLIEWFIKLFFYGHKAYYFISFECEAFKYESSYYYREHRRHYAWLKYVFYPRKANIPQHK